MPENNEILQISDGTTIISLVDPGFGFWLDKWNPAIADYKRGGTWQNSSLARGRRLVQKKFENTIEKFTVKLVAEDEELGIENLQGILRLFEKASDYWATDWQDEMVWIEARGACETNSRFAIIHRGRIPDLQDPYAQPWFGGLLDRAVMEDLSVIIERGDWLATQPGTSTCVQTNTLQNWNYLDNWEEITALPEDTTQTITQVANGDIYSASGDQEILKSDDNGDTWAVNLAGAPLGATDNVYDIMQLSNGDILAGGSARIIKSDDNGASWANLFTTDIGIIYEIIQLANGDIIAGGTDTASGAIWRSVDNGASWIKTLDPVTAGGFEDITALIQSMAGTIIAGNELALILRSVNNGVTWVVVQTLPGFSTGTGQIHNIIEASDGNLYLSVGGVSPERGEIWWSKDDGLTWQKKFATVEWASQGVLETSENGTFYVGSMEDVTLDSLILKSVDYGISFNEITRFGTQGNLRERGLLQAADGKIYASAATSILRTDPDTTVSLGRSATCTNESYLANKSNVANITHIKLDDGGVFTDLFPMSTFPKDLLPTVPALNDALYFGIQSSVVNSGPFPGLVFDIDSAINGLEFATTWEYYNGGWVTLTTRDNTNVGQGAFTTTGVNSVHWEQPVDWVTNSIDSITAFWVRLRISTLTESITTPTQQNREIYAPINSYTEIANTEILGDVVATSQLRIQNQSDEDGRNGSGPDLWSNRILIGLRSYDRGNNFQAFLNASDEQNPLGIIVTVGSDGSFIDDITAPTGRVVSFDPAASATIATAVTFTLSPSIARDFYGKFHVFVRGNMLGGVTNEVGIRLQVINGSGGITFTTETKFFQSIADWELIDLGRITIPVGGVLKSTDLGDQTQLIIQASTTSGIYAPDVRIYDLVLMPVDEWQGDFVDFANVTDSIIGRNNDLPKYLDIDSITNPKAGAIQSLVRIAGSDLITSIYNTISPGEAILQANAQQRLWFLSARTSTTGTDFQWISEPWVAHSVQVFKNQRYLAMRGDN